MADGPEKRVENKIKTNLEKIGAYYLKNFAGPNTAKGHPDITAVSSKNRGKLWAIEVKKPIGGKPTTIQIERLCLIAQNGGRSVITADPLTPQYLAGELDRPVDKIKIKQALSDKEKIWTKRTKGTEIVEIIK